MNEVIVNSYLDILNGMGVEKAEEYLKEMGDQVTDEVKAAITEAMKPTEVTLEEVNTTVSYSEPSMDSAETSNDVA